MNVTLTKLGQLDGRILDSDQLALVGDISSALWIVFSFTGIVTNIMNIKTFVTMGLEDGVTVTFFTLSCSDLGFSSLLFMIGITSVFDTAEEKYGVIFPIQPFAVMVVASNIGFILYAVTGMITLLLAVVRCMCVARPLHFKNVFTRSRSVQALLFFAFLGLICYIPMLTQTGTQRKFDPSINRTRIVLWVSPVREKVKDITALIVDTIFTLVSEVVIVICIIIMVKCLNRSGQFRLAASMATGNDEKLSGKELRVVRQVVLISIIYSACMLPKIFIAIYSLIDPEFDISKKHHNLYIAISKMRTNTELINSASTFPIYYWGSSKFRDAFFRKKLVVR